MSALEYESIGERANKAIRDMGLTRASAMLSEGFCPLCRTRGSDQQVVDVDPDEERNATATVNCTTCMTRWRTGLNEENGRDWIEHGRSWRDGILMTMTLNAPRDPVDEDEDYWDEDYWGEEE